MRDGLLATIIQRIPSPLSVLNVNESADILMAA